MSDLKMFHIEGKLTNILSESFGEMTVYRIRVATPVNARIIDGRENEKFGQDDFLDIVAFGTNEDDRWAQLSKNDLCAIDGVVEWHGKEGKYDFRNLVREGTVRGKKVRETVSEMVRADGGNPIFIGTDVSLVDIVRTDHFEIWEGDTLPGEWYNVETGMPILKWRIERDACDQ